VPATIFGLPTHPLVVHAVVVLVPLACLLALASAVSPRFRQWARWATPITAVVGLALVPVATDSGEGLESRVGHSALIEKHSELADSLLPLMAVLALFVIVLTVLHRRGARGAATIAVAALVGLASVATLVQVVRIGHSGANAVWHGTPAARSGGGDEG
jgi:hypothetical protein